MLGCLLEQAYYANSMWSRQHMFVWMNTFPCRMLPSVVMGKPHLYYTTSFKLSNSFFSLGDSACYEYIPLGFWHSSQLMVPQRQCPASIPGGAPLACCSLRLSNDGQQLFVVFWPFSCSNGKKWPGLFLSGWGSGRKYGFVKRTRLETDGLHTPCFMVHVGLRICVPVKKKTFIHLCAINVQQSLWT